jgi:hypothetical protein
MDTSIGTGRSPSSNKEDSSDILPKLRGNDCEQSQAADPKVIQRATLKIDFYLTPIAGMFCVSSLPLVSPSVADCSPLAQTSWDSW